MKEAYLYKKLSKNRVQCRTCAHYCIIDPSINSGLTLSKTERVEDGKRGICGVKENRGGKLYSLVYGKACAVNIDPIEKKPFFHFLPGSQSLSIATVGCNFACHSCQNWTISQGPKISGMGIIEGEKISSEKIVKIALENNLPSISYTYTEPSIFLEYALDTMKIAKSKGLKNCWVTNGFLSEETLNLISPYLDAANVDLKGFSESFYKKYCQGRLQPVLDTLKRMREKNIWPEITTLVIPTLNDDEKTLNGIANFIKKELGPETPWHISRFSGAISWKLQKLPDTPIETIKKALKIGKKAGLKYVYSGNVPGLESENTFCPKCGAKMIGRIGYIIKRYDKDGKCKECGTDLNLILK